VGAARRHFALVRDILREQLGIAPSAQLAALIGRAPERRPDASLRAV